MRVRDLPLHVRCGEADQIRERADERSEDRDARDLEDGVRRGDAAGLRVLPDRREERGGRGADVRPEDHGDRAEKGHEPTRGERQREADDRRAGAHESGEDRREDDEQQGLVGERPEEVREQRARRQRRGAVCDELHAEEEEAEPKDGLADVADRPAARDLEEPAHEHDEGGVAEDVECEELHRDGRADVRAEDHADRLAQREEARGREADEHDRRRARRLEDRRRARADRERLEAVPGEGGEDVPQPRAGGPLQALADESHAVEKKRRPAEQREEDEIGVVHVFAGL